MTWLDWILENIPEGSSILELGSGESTAKLCERYHVRSIEHDPKFVASCDPRANCYHAPLVNGWYDPAVVMEAAAAPCDLILVDGPPGAWRSGIIHNFDLFDWSGWSVWDDTNRPVDLAAFNAAQMHMGGARDLTIHQGKEKSFNVIHPLH